MQLEIHIKLYSTDNYNKLADCKIELNSPSITGDLIQTLTQAAADDVVNQIKKPKETLPTEFSPPPMPTYPSLQAALDDSPQESTVESARKNYPGEVIQ